MRYILIIIATFSFLIVSTVYAEQEAYVNDLIKKSKEGDNTSQYKLGKIYAEGDLVERDRDLAKKLFIKSAENGNADAQVVLSLMYHLGSLGFPYDQIQAYAWADAASRQDRENAREIANDYANELNLQELEEAKALAQKYYKLYVEPFYKKREREQRPNIGNDISQYEIDPMYTEENAKKRISPPDTTYIECAKNGDPNAQVALGLLLYSSGRAPGYPLDLVQAYAWTDAAARQGDESARNIANDIMEELDFEEAKKAKALAEEYYKLYVKPFEEK
jgi:hypothetical protein